MDLDFEIYKNKKFSQVCKAIVENSEKRKAFIDEQLKKLPKLVTNLGEAMAVYPLMTSMIDAGTRNDDQLIKFASVIQKVISKGEANGDSLDSLISEDLQAELNSIQEEYMKKEENKAKEEKPVETTPIEISDEDSNA